MFQHEVTALDAEGRKVALRVPLKMAEKDATWVQLAYEGVWNGHPRGPFEFTKDVFGQIVRNFKAQKNPITFYYEHPSHKGDGSPIPAAGWITELAVKQGVGGAELWGFTKFNRRAAQFIREDEYKFCSVVVDFASVHRATDEDVGAELLEVGLTNVPFLDGMQAIQLTRTQKKARPSAAAAPVRRLMAAGGHNPKRAVVLI